MRAMYEENVNQRPIVRSGGVPTWDVNKALEGRVGTTGSFRGNLMHGEGEYAIPARVPPENIKRWGVVKSDARGRLYVDWHGGKQ
jgi:hypothetical protein